MGGGRLSGSASAGTGQSCHGWEQAGTPGASPQVQAQTPGLIQSWTGRIETPVPKTGLTLNNQQQRSTLGEGLGRRRGLLGAGVLGGGGNPTNTAGSQAH